MKLTKEEIERKFPPIINGTYKKDNPDKEIGYQKWEVRKTYEVDVLYTIVTKTKKEAEELLERRETPEQEVDDYGDDDENSIFRGMCPICSESVPIDCVFLDCGHNIYCWKCGQDEFARRVAPFQI